jgi:hypothetical protein
LKENEDIKKCYICGEILYGNNTEKHHVLGKEYNVIIDICKNCHNMLHYTRSGGDFYLEYYKDISEILSDKTINIQVKRLFFRFIYMLSQTKKLKELK